MKNLTQKTKHLIVSIFIQILLLGICGLLALVSTKAFLIYIAAFAAAGVIYLGISIAEWLDKKPSNTAPPHAK